MSESQSESGPGALVAALDVPANARRGFLAAALLTSAVFVFFVVIPGARRSPLLYVALAFVLLVSLGGLLTVLLTLVSAVRLARQL